MACWVRKACCLDWKRAGFFGVLGTIQWPAYIILERFSFWS